MGKCSGCGGEGFVGYTWIVFVKREGGEVVLELVVVFLVLGGC